MFTPFQNDAAAPKVHGFLHSPGQPNGDGLVLTHGAGGNCKAKLLVAVAESLAASGFFVLRFDLPYRLERPFGPPHPAGAERDRQGLRRAAEALREVMPSAARMFLAGHSYGGRQASMLLAEDAAAADGVLLLSYPLHPPKQPGQLRTKHFPDLRKPTFFVHGTRDPFASVEELQAAVALIPATHAVLEVENAGHDLLVKKEMAELPARIASEFLQFVAGISRNP